MNGLTNTLELALSENDGSSVEVDGENVEDVREY